MSAKLDSIREKAKKAADKKAAFGIDVDVSSYSLEAPKHTTISSLAELPENAKEKALATGINWDEKKREASFFQMDHSVVFEKGSKGVEILGLKKALEKYGLEEYYWNAVDVELDKYTAEAELHNTDGYFIRAAKGYKTAAPVQACLFINKNNIKQNVHNIIIAEEGSKLDIITGCTTAVEKGMHIGISEFFVKKNATVTFTMIHNWAEDMDVRPRTVAIVEEGGTFISNYICLKPVKSLQLYPASKLIGTGAKARFHNIIYGHKNSKIDAGGKVILSARETRAEITTRTIATDSAEVIARGHLAGYAPATKAHLECKGLMLSNKARIYAVPEIDAKSNETDLSHEASVGKIEDEQLHYLMARGLTKEESRALIVRGFLDPEIPGLDEKLKSQIRKTLEMTAKDVL